MDLKQISCEFCKKNLYEKSLLLHISKSKNCKAYYGKRYDDLKKEKNKEKKQLWRKVNGKNELKRQRELYKENPCKSEKKRKARKEKEEKLEKERKALIEKQEKLEKEKAEKILFKRKHHEEKDDPFVIQCLFCSSSYEYMYFHPKACGK